MKYLYVFLSSLTICFGSLFAYEFSIAAMFRNEAPYFKEWIEFHLLAGAEHFWLYDNLSEDNFKEVLAPYIQQGIVEVIPWTGEEFNIENTTQFPFLLQSEMVKDALCKAKGKSAWLAIIDIDEFLFPKKEKTITQCLEKHFSQAGAVFVSWLNFGTSGVYVPEGEPILDQLTKCSMRSYQKNGNGKSIWRPEKVDLDSIHWVHWANLTPGSTYVNGDGNVIVLEGEGANWDWALHDKHIRINHYFLRDENFFQKNRIGLTREGKGAYREETLWEFYELLSRIKDFAILNFLKTHHSDKYKEFWRKDAKNPY